MGDRIFLVCEIFLGIFLIVMLSHSSEALQNDRNPVVLSACENLNSEKQLCDEANFVNTYHTPGGNMSFCSNFTAAGLKQACALNQSCSNGQCTNGSQATTVLIGDFEFFPSDLQITSGTLVTWVNDGLLQHTVISDNGSELNSGTLNPGQSYTTHF